MFSTNILYVLFTICTIERRKQMTSARQDVLKCLKRQRFNSYRRLSLTIVWTVIYNSTWPLRSFNSLTVMMACVSTKQKQNMRLFLLLSFSLCWPTAHGHLIPLFMKIAHENTLLLTAMHARYTFHQQQRKH